MCNRTAVVLSFLYLICEETRMRLLMIIMLLATAVAGAAEIPMQPFEPFDTGREYRREDIAAARDGQFPDDPFFAKQWHLENLGQADDKGNIGEAGCDISMRKAWDLWNPKQEVILAILDSGLDLKHEDIDPRVLWVNPGESGVDANGNDKANNGIDDDGNGFVDDVNGYNFVRENGIVQDDQYHGTHCGAIICSPMNNGAGVAGMNPRIKIMLVKIFGLGKTLYAKDIARAVRYAVDNGARVLSNSYGTPSYTPEMHEAVRYTHEKGALFVCASGNSRKDLDNPEEKDYPACYGLPNQLVVSATDNADWSQFANYGSMVEIAAPGANIFSLMPKNVYRSFSGTSQACPQVAAAATMVWSQNPEFTWQQVKQTLIDSADETAGLGRYVKDGRRLNVANALQNRPGRRLPTYDFSSWVSEERVIESSHPYWNDKEVRFSVEVPQARRFRLFFERIEIDHHGDFLQITRPDSERPVEKINRNFSNCFSEVIEGDIAELLLSADKYMNAYGFKISKIQYQPR
ncbi:MAG: hypothetical protein CVV41_04390 [Candidatus Riflebacteria bacterium HGW-Riflebacteria-1]|jgi:subtilisin family serine protease|nr:MAG: hypothetical protein CVV41_04390 [Candidatus Riflebacteria bacterium HGW-Riflebacteria-1]